MIGKPRIIGLIAIILTGLLTPVGSSSEGHAAAAEQPVTLGAAADLFWNDGTVTINDFSGGLYIGKRHDGSGVWNSRGAVRFNLDSSGPPDGSIAINNGYAYTSHPNVVLSLTGSDYYNKPLQMRFSNDSLTWSGWEPFMETKEWSLSHGDGIKTVYYELSNGDHTSQFSDAVTLDTIPPIVSGVTHGSVYSTNVMIAFSEGAATLNGTPFTNGSTVSVDGDYDLIVTDAAGNTATVHFTIDKSAPVVTGVTDGAYYNSDVVISFNKGTATLNGNSFTSSSTVSAEGEYTLIVKDTAGNTTTVAFTIDKTSPTVSGVTNGASYNRDVAVSFSEGTAALNGHSFTSGSTISAEGSYILIVNDEAGNETTVAFAIDKTAPTVSGVINGASYNSDVVVSFNEGTATLNGKPFTSGSAVSVEDEYTLIVIDAAGNKTTMTFTIDKKAPDVSGVTNGASYNSDVIITFNEGSATLNGKTFTSGSTVSIEDGYTLVVKDAAGNSTTVAFTIDKTPPVVSGVTNGSSYNTDVSISFNEGTATLNGKPYTGGTAVSTEGDYTLIVKDAVGNTSTIAFSIDKTAPAVSGVTHGASYNTDVIISFNEGAATLNGKPFASGSAVSAEGEYSLSVTDAAGNSTTASFIVDKTSPTITGLIDGKSHYSSPVTISFNEGTATLNGASFASGTRIASSGNYTLVVTDTAGNRTSVVFTIAIPVPGGGSNPVPEPEAAALEININGVSVKDLAKRSTASDNGKNVTTVTFESKLTSYLDSMPDSPNIVIPVQNQSDHVILLMNGPIIKALKDRDGTLEMTTEQASYLLAADQIDWSLVARELGSDDSLRDMTIRIEIAAVSDNAIKQAVQSEGARIVSPAIEFTISAAIGSHTTDLASFNRYVERRIAISDKTQPAGATLTGITITKDGKAAPLPTRIIQENGRSYAVIHSMTNSVYAVMANKKTFSDIQQHWAQSSIEQAAAKLIVQGISQTSFQPNKQVTRAEFTAILIRALGLHTFDKPASFEDVNRAQWYYESASIAEAYGLVAASGCRFDPNEPLTRQEAMVLIAKAMGLVKMNAAITEQEIDQQIRAFKDADQLKASVRAAAATNVKYGIIVGDNGQLSPEKPITRAETVTIIQRLLDAAKLN